jgi:hypothetical protein
MDSTLDEKELGADEPLSRLQEELSKLSHVAAHHPSDPQPKSINTFRPAASGNRISLGGWALRGFAGILLAAGIGVAGVIWLGSPGDAAKTAPSQPAPLIQTAPTAAVSPELMPLLQSMARDLASMGKEIEQLKAGRDLTARDNAKLSEQLKATQEQLTRSVAGLSEQLKTGQEQAARDNANVTEQVRGIREQLTFDGAARSPAKARKAKTTIDVAAAGARALRLPMRTDRPNTTSSQLALPASTQSSASRRAPINSRLT